jgi:hypothetical protein
MADEERAMTVEDETSSATLDLAEQLPNGAFVPHI